MHFFWITEPKIRNIPKFIPYFPDNGCHTVLYTSLPSRQAPDIMRVTPGESQSTVWKPLL